MTNKTRSFFVAAITVLAIASCASIPIDLKAPQEMFTDTLPSNICYLRTVRKVRLIGLPLGFNSTGTLVESQYLVTAAHNLYDSNRTRLIGVQVSCKGNNGQLATSVVSQDGINRTRKVGHYDQTFSTDYAFLKLNRPIPVKESIYLNRDVDLEKVNQIEVAGYPGGVLQHGSGKLVLPTPSDSTFYYEVDTARGMSGGPVWVEGSLIGVHVSEGRARLVNDELIQDFENWKSRLE